MGFRLQSPFYGQQFSSFHCIVHSIVKCNPLGAFGFIVSHFSILQKKEHLQYESAASKAHILCEKILSFPQIFLSPEKLRQKKAEQFCKLGTFGLIVSCKKRRKEHLQDESAASTFSHEKRPSVTILNLGGSCNTHPTQTLMFSSLFLRLLKRNAVIT